MQESGSTLGALVATLKAAARDPKAALALQALLEVLAVRTRELETVHRELESFTHSVSHDLRAPLRSMDGYSQALLEEYEGRLDDLGRLYLVQIRDSARRLTRLLDGLGTLSRVTTAPFRCEPVDLTAIARTALVRLQRAAPERRAETRVEDGLLVQGDRKLLELALDQLLENAWKFSGRQAVARIEVGAREERGSRAIYVEDNGVGFDMAYADKLFEVFQRLHGVTDFEGVGVGLAIVQLVIRRHRGSLWAKATEGQGAVFSFTIGEGRQP